MVNVHWSINFYYFCDETVKFFVLFGFFPCFIFLNTNFAVRKKTNLGACFNNKKVNLALLSDHTQPLFLRVLFIWDVFSQLLCDYLLSSKTHISITWVLSNNLSLAAGEAVEKMKMKVWFLYEEPFQTMDSYSAEHYTLDTSVTEMCTAPVIISGPFEWIIKHDDIVKGWE